MVKKPVYFPTDLHLLYDSGRKCLEILSKLGAAWLPGWQKIKYWLKKWKRHYLLSSRIHRKGGKHKVKHLKQAVKAYLSDGLHLYIKVSSSLKHLTELLTSETKEKGDISQKRRVLLSKKISLLRVYAGFLNKFIDLTQRRILLGETIPHEEKIFSIFEPDTEWINKGKSGNRIELGHQVLITTDQNHFCLDWQVMRKQHDSQMVQSLHQEIGKKYPDLKIESWSFDKNFYSKDNYEYLEEQVTCVTMPKKGKRSKKQQAIENQDDFRYWKSKHATVEANIAQIQHHGAIQCPDKGAKAFDRYVGLAVIAYNLHRIGNIVKQKKRKKYPMENCTLLRT